MPTVFNRNTSTLIVHEYSRHISLFIIIFNKNDGVEKFSHTPIEFINLLANSSCVITNSFHGACMAKVFDINLIIHKNNRSSDARFDIFRDYKKLV